MAKITKTRKPVKENKAGAAIMAGAAGLATAATPLFPLAPAVAVATYGLCPKDARTPHRKFEDDCVKYIKKKYPGYTTIEQHISKTGKSSTNKRRR